MSDVKAAETVAVVVVTYSSGPLLADLVGSLDAGLRGLDWHLTIADNASPDDTVDTARMLAPKSRIIEMGRNAGYAAGINAAVRAADPHTAILVLNPDIRLTAGCVAQMLAVLRRSGAGIVVPRLERGDGYVIPVLRREPTLLRAIGDAVVGMHRAGRVAALGETVVDPESYRRESQADWAAGPVMLISGSCWDQCGQWDESFFLYSEETEFCLRARDAGFPTRLAPAALATHLEGDSKRAPGLWALLVLNRLRLYRRRHGLPATAAYWSALVAREASRAVFGRRVSRAALRALLSPTRLREVPGPHSVHAG